VAAGGNSVPRLAAYAGLAGGGGLASIVSHRCSWRSIGNAAALDHGFRAGEDAAALPPCWIDPGIGSVLVGSGNGKFRDNRRAYTRAAWKFHAAA